MTTDIIKGADVSTLEDTEKQGGKFYADGKEKPLLEILSENGVTSARLRLWHNPYTKDGAEYGGGTSDLEKTLRLAKRVKAAGMSFILDFHYSDFWCDPARQGIPKAWQNLEENAVCGRIYHYTCDVLKRFEAEGVPPEYVQVGNEITNGMLWPLGKIERDENGKALSGFKALADFVKAGCSAVRAVSKAKIILHLEQSGKNALWREWFDAITSYGVDFDIIGASYYPLWHGSLENMKANFDDMISRYNKDVMIVETAYPFTCKHFNPESKRLMIDENFTLEDGSKPKYPFTKEGQAAFIHDLLETVRNVKDGRCLGIYYWEPGWLPTEGSTWATEAALKDIGEEEKGTGNEWANQCLFDYDGNANPALYELK